MFKWENNSIIKWENIYEMKTLLMIALNQKKEEKKNEKFMRKSWWKIFFLSENIKE